MNFSHNACTCKHAMPPACTTFEAPLKQVVIILFQSLETGVPSEYLQEGEMEGIAEGSQVTGHGSRRLWATLCKGDL